jgi:hypothetical protein
VRAGLAALIVLAALLGGCGLGEGDEREGAGVSLRVTRDFGTQRSAELTEDSVREDETVMRLLRSELDVETRFGGRFVQAIDGLAGSEADQRAWFFWVNGIESSVGATEFELTPGDVVQWDLREWGAAMRVPAIVGAFPEPFVHGFEGKRFPVRLECVDLRSSACDAVETRLEAVDVPVNRSSLGAPATSTILRVVVGRWDQLQDVKTAQLLEDGPQASGVFARLGADGRSLELLDGEGGVARRVEPGEGVGLVAALRPSEDELMWVVTGLDDAGVQAAAAALRQARLRDRFAVAVRAGETEALPVVGR